MKLTFAAVAWEQYRGLRDDEPAEHEKLDVLIAACLRDPFKGIGKPEPLKGELRGAWSRRITREHRLVYRVSGSGDDQTLEVVQCQFHYGIRPVETAERTRR